MRTNTRLKVIVLLLITALGVAIDRVSKNLCVESLSESESVQFIPNILNFTYIKNKGAAFGSLANARWVFMIASCILIVAVTIYIFKNKDLSKLDLVALSMIVAGGVGNMIDRIVYGYVVDFIDVVFVPYWKWIFNIADSLVCVGAAIFVISFIVGEIKNKKGKEKDVNTEA